ncbi:MAG TPA: histidine kinase dimerization/phospho-acceptor domain-containing protein [Polyangiaceae bacterium]|jgi:signal transduction histidine kinase|nr:histidine kinase dimerization/phospho-acceptor domain-containing protein [Polyangiaceae bacterium]
MIRLIVVAAACIGLILLVAFIATRLVGSRVRGTSIRMQVFIALAAIVGAFAFGLGVMVIDRIEARAHRFALLGATEQAGLMAQILGIEMETYGVNLDTIAKELPQRTANRELEGVELFDQNGVRLFRSKNGLPNPRASQVHFDAEVIVGGVARGRVRVTKATLVIEGLLKDFAPSVLVISLVLGAAAALAAAWIGRAIGGPIELLSQFSEKVAAGDRNALAPLLFHGREVTRLSRSLDSMRRQLEGRPFVETFAADLSHELKNPVAAIRASAEILADGALDEPVEALRFVQRILEATNRIERLLGDLLGLARIEARGVEEYASIELKTMIESCITALDAKGRVQLDAGEPVMVRGDQQWLSRAISNLVDNALIHSDGPVMVRVGRDGTQARMHVTNSGAIQGHTKTRIFGRFVTTRADKGGTGLGLAITRAVAEAHRGQVLLCSAGPPNVEFELSLPLA